MTDRVDSEDASADVHRAVVTLHEAAGTYEGIGRLPGFARPPFGEALSALADAPPEEATTGAKLDTLVALAKADFPKYDEVELSYVELARAIGSPYGLDAQQVLDDVKAVGIGGDRIVDTVTGQALPHNATAFVGEDVCHIAEVIVEGIKSVWVFSEFETNAPFGHVAEWVRPQNWPKRGSAMFKGMDVVGGQVTDIPEGSFTDHWHGVFLEDVQLFERLKTLLHCDYVERRDESAGMTYALTFSVDKQLTVDRGFLLAENIGTANAPLVRVKALKVVAFADEAWNEVAKLVCPFWTDFVRQAAEGGSTTMPKTPQGGGVPFDIDPGPVLEMAGELCRVWIDFFGDSAKEYAGIAGTVMKKMTGGGYKVRDAVGDGTSYWSQLAKDWAKAWGYGTEMVEAIAKEGLVAPRPPGAETSDGERFVPIRSKMQEAETAQTAGATQPVAGAAAGSQTTTSESVIVPVAAIVPSSQVSCGELTGIEAGGPRIPAAAVTTDVVDLGGGSYGVRVSAATSGVPAGLYTGELTLGGGQVVPVALYVSHARPTR